MKRGARGANQDVQNRLASWRLRDGTEANCWEHTRLAKPSRPPALPRLSCNLAGTARARRMPHCAPVAKYKKPEHFNHPGRPAVQFAAVLGARSLPKPRDAQACAWGSRGVAGFDHVVFIDVHRIAPPAGRQRGWVRFLHRLLQIGLERGACNWDVTGGGARAPLHVLETEIASSACGEALIPRRGPDPIPRLPPREERGGEAWARENTALDGLRRARVASKRQGEIPLFATRPAWLAGSGSAGRAS